ncbi:MAG: single stranded DNA-binding domain-containing protein [Candidatus Helarchaeales archaeon]
MTDIKDLKENTEDTVCGQVIRILRDKDNKWIMYRLIDGTGEIPLFSQADLGIENGEFILCVNCWVRKGAKGLNLSTGKNGKIITGDEIKANPLYQRVRERMARKPVIFINDIREQNLQKIQFAGCINEIFPTKSNHVDSKKLVAIDMAGQLATIMFYGEEVEMGRGFHEGEFFVINGIVQRFKNTIIIQLGPDGRIFRGKDASETPAGRMYFELIEKNNPDVILELLRRRKMLQEFVRNEILNIFNLNEEILEELLPRLTNFIYRKIFQRKYWRDNYYNCLKELQLNSPQGINEEYKKYLIDKIRIVIELAQKVFPTLDRATIEAIISTLYDSTIDMETFNTKQEFCSDS